MPISNAAEIKGWIMINIDVNQKKLFNTKAQLDTSLNGLREYSDVIPWKVLVVDDEEGIHTITDIALEELEYDNRPVKLLHAYTALEAKALLTTQPDIALVLLDVVMESDDAGIALVDVIRNELNNHRVRIVLRTGQPGQAPEKEIIQKYDINDYKEKTELTKLKLFTTVFTALRSYRDISALDQNRQGLEKVISASASILKEKSLKNLAQGALEQLAALLYVDGHIILTEYDSLLAERGSDGLTVLANVHKGSNTRYFEEFKFRLKDQVNRLITSDQNFIEQEQDIYFISRNHSVDTILAVRCNRVITKVEKYLIELFCRNISIALDNIRLNESMTHSQKEIVFSICELAESHSKETGNHVRRVAHYSKLMAEALGLKQPQCEELFIAAPLHDVGKIGIPDSILNKPGKLDEEELKVMKTHTTIGANSLSDSKQPVLRAGAIIALQHHENWDGTGYPNGLSGEQIHIYGRIVALADVFDALASKRCYKDAWSYEEIDAWIESQSGLKFDPDIVCLYMAKRGEFRNIFEQFSDE